MAETHIVVHDKTDTVGVVVVEGIKPKMKLTGWVMETNKTIRMTVLHRIPIGHKIALRDLRKDDTVIKYGHDIGRVVAAVKKGGHVHVHNLKTKRW